MHFRIPFLQTLVLLTSKQQQKIFIDEIYKSVSKAIGK